MLKQDFERFARYNVWANSVFCNYFSTYPDQILEQDVDGSFRSIKRLLTHLWEAENIWYERLHGRSPSAMPGDTFSGGSEEVFDKLISQSTLLKKVVNGLSDTQLAEVVDYTTISGSHMSNSRSEILQHVFNHSTYHRGQLVVYSYALKLSSPPSTDFIRFLRLP